MISLSSSSSINLFRHCCFKISCHVRILNGLRTIDIYLRQRIQQTKSFRYDVDWLRSSWYDKNELTVLLLDRLLLIWIYEKTNERYLCLHRIRNDCSESKGCVEDRQVLRSLSLLDRNDFFCRRNYFYVKKLWQDFY